MLNCSRPLGVMLVLVGFTLFAAGEANAQKKRVEPVSMTGTVVSLEKPEKSRTFVLKIKDAADETEHEFPLLPRTPLTITARGDVGFLRPGLLVSAELVQSNQLLFGKEFTVYAKGGPAPYVQQGNAKEVFEVCGKIVAVEGELMTVNFGAKGTQQVHLETGYSLKVVVTDPELVPPGADVEVEAIPLRGGKAFNPTRINITLDSTIQAEEYYAKPNGKRNGGKTETKPATPEVNDPFGLLKKPGATPKPKENTEKDE